jgi:phospholipase/carboxylesterase
MMIHTIIQKQSSQVIILFHGTGGNEYDLLEIGKMIDPEATLIGIRGNIQEGSMNRFFKRKAPGVFDIDNLIKETKIVRQTLDELAQKYDFSLQNTTLVGYSNGANIIGSLLYHYGRFIKGAVLLHPMVPIKDFAVVNQEQLPVLISAGKNDPICPMEETNTLHKVLKEANADVSINWYHFGHQLSHQEIQDVQKWYQK